MLRSGHWFEAAPCVELGAGSIHAEGIIARPNQDTRLWADFGLSARARFLATQWLAVEGQAGVVAPLTRYTLDFHDPDEQLYRVPAVGARIGLGVAGRIP